MNFHKGFDRHTLSERDIGELRDVFIRKWKLYVTFFLKNF